MREQGSLTQGIRLAMKVRWLAMSERSESNGPRRDRTADLYTASVALSQLSYEPLLNFTKLNFTKLNLTKLNLANPSLPTLGQPKDLQSPIIGLFPLKVQTYR